MADWLKWMKGLGRRREVLAIAHRLSITRGESATACMECWEWADDNSRNGKISNVTVAHLDIVTGIQGFGMAMSESGWVKQTDAGIEFPKWARHNSSTAKSRALAAERMARKRENDKRAMRNGSATGASRKAQPELELELEPETVGTDVRSVNELEGSAEGNQDEFEIDCLSLVEESHLSSVPALCEFHRMANTECPAAVASSQAGLLRILASARHAVLYGKKTKPGLFGWLMRNPSRAKICGPARGWARTKLAEHRNAIAAGQQMRPNTIPLCDMEPTA